MQIWTPRYFRFEAKVAIRLQLCSLEHNCLFFFGSFALDVAREKERSKEDKQVKHQQVGIVCGCP